MKIVFLILIVNFVYAKNNRIIKLKDALTSESLRVTKLAAKIKTLDKSISSNNRKYLDSSVRLGKLEKELTDLKESLEKSGKEVGIEYELISKIFRQYLLEKIDIKNKNLILKDKIYIETLSLQLQELESSQKKSNDLLKSVNTISNNLELIKKQERELYDIIVSLENEKRDSSEHYLNVLEKKNSLREKLEKEIVKNKVSKKRKVKRKYQIVRVKNSKMRLPLDKFLNYKGGKKGITFTFGDVAPVLATSSGHVAYSGELASYGKIIMIDHGNDVRSLVLGDIKINVKKGQYVDQGQVLAYTISEPGMKKNLYYELRKKNIAQNTLKILKENKIL